MRLFELLAPLLGSDIKQIINQLHWKPAGSLISDFAFHQDARFRKPAACYRNLAESYYIATPALSWQGVVLGDPLCSLGKP